jgi:hypothetical protein
MQIAILNGIYTNEASDFRTSYPRNLIPVPKEQGISQGYLRPADGIVEFASGGPGKDRGGINWLGECYRVMGQSLVKVKPNGVIEVLASVGGAGLVTFDYSFDYLAISSSGSLYYWDGAVLTQVTDSDLGAVLDFIWVDGYFMTTDGEFLVVTELNDPFSINPLKYGSSEADPDPIKAVLKLRNEPHALNRHTIEAFSNQGGDNFPFQRIDGAQIQRGTVGTYTCCVFMEAIAFMGGGRNEAIAIWLGASGNSIKISTREIDQILAEYSEDELSLCLMESRTDKGHMHLYIHLPDQTIVYDGAASKELQQPVWFTLTTSIVGNAEYLARNLVWCYGKWLVGHPDLPLVGYLSEDVSSHWGEVIGPEFGTMIVYNEGRGAIMHDLELVPLTGRAELGADPTIWTQYSTDGETWSMERSIKTGKQGQRNKRLVWMQQGHMRNWRIQRFRWTSDAHMSVARLEARLEPLAV